MKYSIVCPVFNGEKFITKCVNNIQNFNYDNWELIFVNDGSTDNTKKIINLMIKKDKRIKIINQKNQGPYIARYNGYCHSTGTYILTLDVDDCFNADTLNILLKIIKKYEFPDLINFNGYICKNNNVKCEIWDEVHYNQKLCKTKKEIFDEYFKNYVANQSLCRKCFKTSLLKKIKIKKFKIFVSEDGIFSLQLLQKINSAIFIDKCLYIYNKFNSTLTKNFVNNIENSIFSFSIAMKLLDKICSEFNLNSKNYIAQIISFTVLFIMNIFQYSELEKNKIKFLKKLRNSSYAKEIFSYKFNRKKIKKNYIIYFFMKYRLYPFLIMVSYYFKLKKLRMDSN